MQEQDESCLQYLSGVAIMVLSFAKVNDSIVKMLKLSAIERPKDRLVFLECFTGV